MLISLTHLNLIGYNVLKVIIMKQLVDTEYVIQYENELESFTKETLAYAKNKRPEFYKLFHCSQEDIGIIKSSFFCNHDNFISYIESISNGKTPPKWAKGCTYNGEIQIFVELDQQDKRMTTLTHETVHMFFNKTIYQYNIQRIRWLDESFAVYLDKPNNGISADKIYEIISSLEHLPQDFDMAILNDANKINTQDYNGYHMFNLIGQYIFENNLEYKFIEIIKNNRDQMLEIGKTILRDSINYFKNKKN